MSSGASVWSCGRSARAGSILVLGMLAAACSKASGGGTGGDATGGGGSSSSNVTTVATTSATTASATIGDEGEGGAQGEGGADGNCLSNDDCIASQYCVHWWATSECSAGTIPEASWCVDRAETCDPDVGRPVCGCDGEVYASGCEASMAGVALDSGNACDAPAGTFDCLQGFCDAGDVCAIERDGDNVFPRCEPLPEACGAEASCGCIITDRTDGTDCACEGEECACEAALAAFCYAGWVDTCLGDGSAGFTIDCNPEP